MKKILLILVVVMFYNCDSGKGQRLILSSSGKINHVSVVIDNILWEENVGNTIRDVIGVPVIGLPQEEPTFSMKQMPPVVFSDFARKNRTVLKIEKGKEADTKFYKDVYAKPQSVVVISGQTNAEIIEQVEANADRIIQTFKEIEIKEKQRRIRQSLNKNNTIEETLGLRINFPSAYRVAKDEDGFFWLRKDLRTGSMNLMLFSIPMGSIAEGEEAVNDVIKLRDSIGKQHIPGPVEGSYMITEEAFTPFMTETIIDNKPALETKSTFEVKNAFMAGPFINYIIKDEVNNRLVVAEGFTFAPSVEKRDYMFELESIIRSISIK